MRSPLLITLDTVRLTEHDANGFLGIQIDAFGEEKSGMPDVEALGVYGFHSRPLDPQVDGDGTVLFGALALTLWEGSDAHAIALYDARGVPGLPTLQKGESAFYGPAANFHRCHADGSLSRLCTSDGTANGQAISDTLNRDGYVRAQPWSVLRDDKTGWHWRHISGARFDIGFIGGLPAPFSAFSTWAKLTAHSVVIEASAIQLGAGSGAQPVAKATTTLATLSSIASALSATSVALNAIGTIQANAAAGPAIASAATAIAAAASAISTATTTLPSRTTTVT